MTFVIFLETCLLLFSACAVATAQHSNCRSSQIQPDIYVISENVTQEHNSLQDAIDNAIVTNNSWLGVPTICLPQGHYRITKQTTFNGSSIALVGTQGTTIECDYDPLPFNEGFDYTWHFNQSRLVHLENISFVNCPYPFRLIAVQNVTVQDCVFR